MKLRMNLAVLAAIAMTSLFCSGCGYGKVSEKAYKYATALYSICSRKDEEHLTEFSKQLTQAKESNEISETEHQWLQQIVEDAENGDWENATRKCRRIMSDQVQH